MKLHIKYMVSLRCKIVVKAELEKLDVNYRYIDLGEVELFEDLTPDQREILRINLLHTGLELMEDKKAILIERIKNAVIEMIIIQMNFPMSRILIIWPTSSTSIIPTSPTCSRKPPALPSSILSSSTK